MDLSSKEFTLNFRGFDNEDPEAVRRFTAFCEANFDLSPDTFCDGEARAHTVVLTHGESPEALEALAKVLREIGARVDVSEGARFEQRGTTAPPSPQELHRLFGHHRENGTKSDAAPSCPYPPLGRTLYLLTRTDGVFDRRRLRATAPQSVETKEPQPPIPRRSRSRVAVCVASLLVGTAALIGAGLLARSAQRNFVGGFEERVPRSSFQARGQADFTRNEPRTPELQSTRSLTATGNVVGFNIDLKVVTSGRSLSISALTMVPTGDTRMSDGSTIKSVVGDPAFLTESSPGQWNGPVRLAVFAQRAGEEAHSTILAQVSVTVNNGDSTGRARIEIPHDVEKNPATQSSANEYEATARLFTLKFPDLPLS